MHDYPGTVRTRFLDYLPEERLKGLTFMPVEECGERHLYMATSAKFAPASGDSAGAVPLGIEDGIAQGSNGKIGSGMYSLLSDCECASPAVVELLAGLREKGLVEEVWRHTEGEFKRITGVDRQV